MTSFWEKLKKGMGITVVKKPEEELEETTELEEKPRSFRKKKVEKIKVEKIKDKMELKEIELNEQEIKKVEEIEETEEKKRVETETGEEKIEIKEEKWFEKEGQLAVDVYETNDYLIIQSAIAGVKPEDLDISIEGDLVTIKGERGNPNPEKEAKYFYQECYWGPFSREIILPAETDPSRVEATMKDGILIIRIPKIERKKKRKIIIKE